MTNRCRRRHFLDTPKKSSPCPASTSAFDTRHLARQPAKGAHPSKRRCPLAKTIDLPPPTDWPLYWFARLEKAVEEGDHQAAAEAQQQLARLGVRVSYGRPRQEVSSAAAC